MNKKLFSTAFLSVAAALGISSCCTIVNGSKQNVGISSSPIGASVTLNGIPRGETPLNLSLNRDEDYVVKISMPGYQSYSTIIHHHVSAWAWGDLVFGGIIGLAIDYGTGSLYYLTPEQVHGYLAQTHYIRETTAPAPTPKRRTSTSTPGRTVPANEDADLRLFVVLKPDPSWKKIGQLDKA